MSNLPPDDWEEEGKWSSAAQAFVIIAAFAALVIFGADLNFTRTPVQATIQVSLIPVPVARASEPKPVQAVKKPEPVKPKAADIALKKKKEEEKRKEKERQDAERKKREEEKRKEDARKEREKKEREKEEKERKKRDAEEREKRERLARQKAAEEAAARQAALNRLKDSYIGRIIGSIEPSLTTPKHLKHLDGLEVVVEVNLHDDGTLNGFPTVAESSGHPEYDEAAVRAVLKASPLPLPPDPELRKEFLNLKLHITPE